MSALPKRKYAKARQGKRRSHLHHSPLALDVCPQCHTPKLSHRVCPNCGNYAGREVIATKTPKAKK